MSEPSWSPGSAHYTHFLGPLLREMSLDDLVKESKRDPFAVEIERRREEAAQRTESARYDEARLVEKIAEARKRFEHL